MTSRHIDIRKCFPVAFISASGHIAVNRRGCLTYGWEINLPVAYTVSGGEYDNMTEMMASAIKVLPPWSIVHRQDTYFRERYHYPEKESGKSFLADQYNATFEGREQPVHRSYIFVTMASKGVVMKKGKRSGLIGFRGIPDIPSEQYLSEFEAKCEEFASIIEVGGSVKVRPFTFEDWMGEGDRVGVIQRYMMLGDESPVISDVMFTPDSVTVHDRTAVAFSIAEAEQLPTEIESTSRMDSMSTAESEVRLSLSSKIGILLDCEHVVNQYVIVPSQQDIMRDIDGRRRRMSSVLSSADNRINSNEMTEYEDDVYKKSLTTVLSHVNIIAWEDKEHLREIKNKLSAALTSMGTTACYSLRATPVLWYAGIPSMACDLGKENMMTMELMSSLCLTAQETFDRGTEGGVFRTCDRLKHTPLYVDTQKIAEKRGLITNYNAFLLGPSGTGKSFFTNSYVRNLYDAGEHVFIIDVGDSYEGVTRIINEQSGGRDGQYNKWSLDNPLSFEAFPGFNDWISPDTGLMRQDHPGIEFTLSFLKTAWKPLDGGWTGSRINILSALLESFVRHSIQEGNDRPIFEDFYRYLAFHMAPKFHYHSPYALGMPDERPSEIDERMRRYDQDMRRNGFVVGNIVVTDTAFNIDDFITALSAYSQGGRFGFLLNDRNPKDLFNSRFVVFEVDALSQVDKDGPFYSLCILCIMNAFDRKMRENVDDFKVMVIEEAWTAISNETMAPYLRSLWKTSRKFSTCAMVVTQEIDDIISSDIIREAIISNSSVKILMDQSQNRARFAKIAEYLGLTPMDCNLIFSMNRIPNMFNPKSQDVFIKLGDKFSAVYNTEVSAAEALAYESNKMRKAPLYELADKVGSLIRAIEMKLKNAA